MPSSNPELDDNFTSLILSQMEAFHTPVWQQWVSKLLSLLILQHLSSYGKFEKHKMLKKLTFRSTMMTSNPRSDSHSWERLQYELLEALKRFET